MINYSIVIPVFNELKTVRLLLDYLKPFYKKGHQVIIINDGSNDGTENILADYNFFILVEHKKNKGKGSAIKSGLKYVENDKVIIFDSDLEIFPSEINKLMILDKSQGICAVIGQRFKHLKPLSSSSDWGNFMFTTFFNIIHNSLFKDVLCCAKSFYLNDIKDAKIRSKGFDIDIELTSIIVNACNSAKVRSVNIAYKRRDIKDGKKLKVSDGWIILKRGFMSFIA